MEKIGYVYLTTNLVNGKQYVGQHLAVKFDKRYKGSGTALKYAFEKYGWDNFKCEILCWCNTQDELNYREQCEIVFHSTFSPNGYNLKYGGSNGKWLDESRKRASIEQKKRFENPEEREKCGLGHVGQVPWNKGIPKTKEQVEKQKATLNKYWDNKENRIKASMAQRKRFENPEERKKASDSHKGKKPSVEALKKMSEARKKYYANEENRKKMSESLLNSPKAQKRRKKVLQYTLNKVLIKEWASLHEIQRELGFLVNGISECCRGLRKTYKGFIWRHADSSQQETSL